ncbi:MAG TPA: 1,4-dihydroxy-2-naphthoate polyprenyltransferase [Bacillota bacterium]|nr:1,4-dihydroxy-2-naphthoate polyprenyltransferase [Bacillota bacterium]
MQQDNIKEALNERGGFQVWWRLLRPHTLTASFVPVFIGTIIAYIDGFIHVPLFIAMLVASILIQAATNMFNEYYDFKRGLDTEHSVGIGGTIVRDGIAPKTVLRLALSFFGIAIILGIYICMETSWWIAVIGLVSMVFGYLYTGGPFPIAYTPFGEIVSGLLMGSVIIGISYYIQAATLTDRVLWISLPVALFIGAIMLSNNIRDRVGDAKSGRKTIAILVGHNKAVGLLAAFFITAYISTIVFVLLGMLPILSLITLISAKLAFDVIKGFMGKTKPLEMMPAMIMTGKTNTIYGLLLCLSLFMYSLYS